MNGKFGQWIPLIAVALMAIAGWMTVRFQAEAALSREDAAQIYVTSAAHEKCEAARDAQLLEMRKLLQETHDAVIRLEARGK